MNCGGAGGLTYRRLRTCVQILSSVFGSSQGLDITQTCMKKIRNQVLTPAQMEAREETSDRLLKTRNPELYFGNLYIECYYFCQQCEDHFEIAGAKSHKRNFFATLFLRNGISFC